MRKKIEHYGRQTLKAFSIIGLAALSYLGLKRLFEDDQSPGDLALLSADEPQTAIPLSFDMAAQSFQAEQAGCGEQTYSLIEDGLSLAPNPEDPMQILDQLVSTFDLSIKSLEETAITNFSDGGCAVSIRERDKIKISLFDKDAQLISTTTATIHNYDGSRVVFVVSRHERNKIKIAFVDKDAQLISTFDLSIKSLEETAITNFSDGGCAVSIRERDKIKISLFDKDAQLICTTTATIRDIDDSDMMVVFDDYLSSHESNQTNVLFNRDYPFQLTCTLDGEKDLDMDMDGGVFLPSPSN